MLLTSDSYVNFIEWVKSFVCVKKGKKENHSGQLPERCLRIGTRNLYIGREVYL